MNAPDWRPVAGSLRTRFLLLLVLIFMGGAATSYVAFRWLARDLVERLGGWYAEKSVLYEKSKVLQLMLREITLAQKLADSPALSEWARDEGNAALRANALEELEDFRQFFRSRSYFFAIGESGNYYYNDDEGGSASRPRYTLDTFNPKDEWFYATLRKGSNYELNVDTDRHLGVTRVWINTVLRDQGRPIAIVGTGLDLTDVIRSVISSAPPGVTNLLVDRSGAIQAHQDISIIDFASIAKEVRQEDQSTVFNLLDRPAERSLLQRALLELSSGVGDTRSLELSIQGRRHLAGVAYIPDINWFVMTLTHPEAAGGRAQLSAVALVLFVALAVTLLVAAFVFDSVVLRRLELLAGAARAMQHGRYEDFVLPAGRDELGSLSRAFRDMAGRIRAHTQELERQVADRTAVLEQLALNDHLTGLLNRRGMVERVEAERSRLARTGGLMGLILFDLDHFKRINDRYGHAAGDAVLVAVAKAIRETTRGYDLCARWGGEEFLVALPDVPDRAALFAIAEKLRRAIRERQVLADGEAVPVTASLGCWLGTPGTRFEAMVAAADAALYTAKQGGRDRVAMAPAED